jgi:uncharacterized damage-inducible protein DinB
MEEPTYENLPEPGPQLSRPGDLLPAYLDFYRSEVLRKLDGLSEDDLRGTRLPSGWSPLELLGHLVHMERRWLVWGFAGEPVAEPWGDQDADGRWHVPADVGLPELSAALLEGGRRTRELVEGSDLDALAPAGPRFDNGPPATLGWILFHVLQEYARHVGHLDVARELVDGVVGEDPQARAEDGQARSSGKSASS